MEYLHCVDCLKTYKPLTNRHTVYRTLMTGSIEYNEVYRTFRQQFLHSAIPKHLVAKMTTRERNTLYDFDDIEQFENIDMRKDLLSKIDRLTDNSKDINIYHKYFNSERFKKMKANFLCLDCEKYLCSDCIIKHGGHFTFSKGDKEISELIKFELVRRLRECRVDEDVNKKSYYVCAVDIVDIQYIADHMLLKNSLQCMKTVLNHCVVIEDALEFEVDVGQQLVTDMCFLSDKQSWLVTDFSNKYIKVLNVHTNELTRIIKLSSEPYGITEVLPTDTCRSLVAVTFPYKQKIILFDIVEKPVHIISTFALPGECYNIGYSNNNVVTLCHESLSGQEHIFVLDLSGTIIREIIPCLRLAGYHFCSMAVHNESRTIYVCSRKEPPCVVSLSLDGRVLNSINLLKHLSPTFICVDRDQNVIVCGSDFPVFILSADLSKSELIIDNTEKTKYSVICCNDDKMFIAVDGWYVKVYRYEKRL